MTPYQKLRKSGKKAAQAIRKNLSAIDYDVKKIMERDPAAVSYAQVLLLYPGLHAVMFHRGAHALFLQEKYFSARCLSQLSRFFTGIEIHPGATIGRGLLIDHGMSVVIGETAEIGDDCTIYQGVTLGGTGKHVGKRHPTIGNNVMIACGAKVLGPFKVGNNSRIASNAVVLSEVPANATAVGAPARVVRVAGETTDCTQRIDQTNIIDPIREELRVMQTRLSLLERQIERKKQNEAV